MTQMIEVKTAELTRRALDYAVAKAVGQRLETHNGRAYVPGSCPDSWTTQQYISSLSMWKPSTDWNQGGPLIEPNRISLMLRHDGWWIACIYNINDEAEYMQLSDCPLEAAMRCLCAAKLGDTVMVPKELLS